MTQLYVSHDSAHTVVQADPEHGIAEEWSSSVRHRDDQMVFASVYGGTADHAIGNAKFVAEALSSHAALKKALKDLLEVVEDARSDETIDATSQAGGYLHGDVMNDAVDAARDLVKGAA